MVNITVSAEVAAAAYALAIHHGSNYSIPLTDVAAEVASFFLPNCTSFALGKQTVSLNATIVAERFVETY
jgi:hypothetical protein